MKKFSWQGKNGPLLIAEIGGNHEGNFNYAKKLVKLAINSGVDVVKLQLYSGDQLVNRIESKSRYKHFKKFELNKNQHIYLAKLCKAFGVQYLASVWDLRMLDWIDKYLKFYKIGSGDLTALPVIKEFARRKKPIILSTGLSNLKEVNHTVNFLQKQNKIYKNKNQLAVLQCTSCYPTGDEEVNLKVMNTLKKKTNLTIGYSHHNSGSLALLAAYTLGAEILEFHFTDERKGKVFRDHKISLNHNETKDLIKNIIRIKDILGTDIKTPTMNEIKSNNIVTFRRAIYPSKDLKSKHKIKTKDLLYLRPNHGIDARDFKKIIGKKLKKDIKYLSKFKLN
jgi:N,N'-diacetyllegionaminate synthase